jgi:hypothetical protein
MFSLFLMKMSQLHSPLKIKFSSPFKPRIHLLAGRPAIEIGPASGVGVSLRRLLEVVRGEAAGGPG